MSASTAFVEPGLWVLLPVAAVMMAGGFVKGAVGFALPSVVLAGLSSFLTAHDAIALLLLPSAMANLWQTFRQGFAAARDTFLRYWRLNLAMAVMLAIVAQFVPRIGSETLYVLLGVSVSVAAIVQLLGWQPNLRREIRRRRSIETGLGFFAGSIGGLTGVWGPAVLYYLIAAGTEKRAQVRMLGLNFLIGWWVLIGAHLQSGLLHKANLGWSAMMLVPVLLGMAMGMRIQDRLNQDLFRQATLVVLILAGLNLLRRGVM